MGHWKILVAGFVSKLSLFRYWNIACRISVICPGFYVLSTKSNTLSLYCLIYMQGTYRSLHWVRKFIIMTSLFLTLLGRLNHHISMGAIFYRIDLSDVITYRIISIIRLRLVCGLFGATDPISVLIDRCHETRCNAVQYMMRLGATRFNIIWYHNTIFHIAQQCRTELNSQTTTHTSPLRASYGVPIVSILDIIHRAR